jgi:hypothetical protein
MARKDDAKGNKVSLTIVVNGQPVEIEGNENAPLQTVLNKALSETQNEAQPPENWEIRDEAGNLLDPSQKIGLFGFAAGTVLLASLKAGAAG